MIRLKNVPLASENPDRRVSGAKLVGLAVVFLWFTLGGILHFSATQIEAGLVPPYIPHPRAAVLISGVFELLGAVGLLWQSSRRIAGIGLFLLTVAVTPVHIYMLQYPERFPSIPYWLLVVRLPVQLGLLALIVWSSSSIAPKRFR